MNIQFSKKILLGLIVCISAINQGSYASGYINLAELNDDAVISRGATLSLPAINILEGAKLSVGETESGFNSSTDSTYLHISGEDDASSKITGEVKINQDGRVLNEAQLVINGTVSNIGQLINQNTIIVGKGGTLSAGTFDSTNNIGTVLNGFKWNTDESKNIRYHEFNMDSFAIKSVESTDPSEALDGTIRFIPGANSDGNINGGNVDLTNYIAINPKVNSNESRTLIFNDCEPEQVDKTMGNQLKNELENVNIQLFNHEEIKNKLILLECLPQNALRDMFNKFTFNNCTAEIPTSDVSDGGYIFKDPSDTNNTIISIQELEPKDTREYKDTNLHKIEYSEDVKNENFDVVRLLFDVNKEKKIYHNYKDEDDNDITTNDGLVLYDAIIDKNLQKLSFSDLFNKYVKYNCYIDSNEATLAYELQDTEKDANPLNLTLKMSDNDKGNIQTNSEETKSWHEKDLYIQVSNNKNVKISNKYQYDEETTNTETGKTTTTTKDDGVISKPLRLNFNNPWDNYTGNLSRQLPELQTLRTIETITGIKSDTAGTKQWLYEQYAKKFISEIGRPDGYTSCDTDAKRILLLARYKLSLINKQNISNLSEDDAYDYLVQLAINDDEENKTIQQSNTEKLTTQIYQNYAGGAFTNYSLLINSNDSDKTSKSDCTNSEILEYTVNHTCDKSNAFSAGNKCKKKPFIVDKLNIGENKKSEMDVVETSDNTYMLAGGLTVNKPFRLKGVLIISPKAVRKQTAVSQQSDIKVDG